MVDLSTTYLGLKLKSPLMVSASPMQENLDNIKHMAEAGAAAVVMHSLYEEQLVNEQRELHHHTIYGTESFAEALTYFPEPESFDVGPDGYLERIRAAKEAVDVPIIASLNGSSLGGWTAFASQIEQAGADALELNIYYIPTDINLSGAEVEQRYIDIVKAVREAVKIPIAVKLSPFFSNMAYIAKQFEEAGANGLVLFNRFYQPDIDIETLEVNRKVLLSEPPELRLPLTWIGILYGRVGVNFAATTGISSAEDAIKMLMVGADVTMMVSALLRNGIDYIGKVEQDLLSWLTEHEYESVNQMRGSMSQKNSPNPAAFERAQYVRTVSIVPSEYPVY
jgi:dihydroorotate dehydrogenase (fumarate)